MVDRTADVVVEGYVLQWSHGLSTVDGIMASLVPSLGAGFNGATAFRPWMDVTTGMVGKMLDSFNGATTFRPWMVRG